MVSRDSIWKKIDIKWHREWEVSKECQHIILQIKEEFSFKKNLLDSINISKIVKK